MTDERRFLIYYLSGGNPDAKILLKWIGKPGDLYPNSIERKEGIKTLEVFYDVWKSSDSLPELRDDLEEQIASVVKMVDWKKDDVPLLEKHLSNLNFVKSTQADSVQNVITKFKEKGWLSRLFPNIIIIMIFHALFWILMIFVVPKSPQIQSIFFWNPWVRRIFGLWYVKLAITLIPYFRSSLFSPFRESLLSDATLEDFNEQAYFKESEVKIKESGKALGDSRPIMEAISEIRGQVVIEGDSGLGKTMFLRDLIKRSKRIVVYLPAGKCSDGVIQAIQAKLHGSAKESNFLEGLIYTGAIDICIDGLNEVSADTRAKVAEFAANYFRGNIIMATQPLEWTPPAKARLYIMQPLSRDKIERFLFTRREILPKDAKISGEDYRKACTDYLNEALDESQPKEILNSVKRILSNPMDLTVVSQMLANGQKPDILNLQEQQYTIMAEEYKHDHVEQEFPLDPFSERVYQMRLNGERVLPSKDFPKEIQCMERHKMVVSQQYKDAQGNPMKEWYFRHEKVWDYFIVHAFLGIDNNRPKKHLGDPLFRGVYFMLAVQMEFKDAETLRELLINYAAETKDHTVADEFIMILRSRPPRSISQSV